MFPVFFLGSPSPKTARRRYPLTEDLQSGQKLDGVLVTNPFLKAPSVIFSRS